MRKSLGYISCDLVLYLEYVSHLTVIPLRPQRKIGLRVYQLCVDAQAVSRTPQTACQRKSCLQLLPDLRRRYTLVAIGQNRWSRENVQPFNLGEFSDDIFGNSVPEVFIFLYATQVLEVQDGDRFLALLVFVRDSVLSAVRFLPDEPISRLNLVRSVLMSVAVW